jgi:hypothetical protein
MEPTRGTYDITEVDNFSDLLNALDRVNESDDPAAEVADILMSGHEGVSGYLTFGNNKVAKNTGIFNMNSATDCPNADSTEDDQADTGVCQVPWESCYAHKAENIYPNALKKRRLQEYLWDNIDADTFAEALLNVKARKRSEFSHLRVSESGDFRHRGDVVKWDRIAQRLGDAINVYTYSASHKIDWSDAEHFTVNQSNGLADYGDRLFSAVPTAEDVPEDAIFCPFEAASQNGVDTDDRPKCGECTACIEPESEQPRSVYITIH